jgi:hypothetical protein
MLGGGQLGAPRIIGSGAKERGRRRTRQDQISLGTFETPGEIADHEIRTERRKLVSSAGPVFERANSLERTIQPFDLMSRRHPLSSMEPPELEFASREANRPKALRTRRHQAAGNFPEVKIHFFFLATLRVFLAVFFTALFAFFAFLAFLAMLPSDVEID